MGALRVVLIEHGTASFGLLTLAFKHGKRHTPKQTRCNACSDMYSDADAGYPVRCISRAAALQLPQTKQSLHASGLLDWTSGVLGLQCNGLQS